MTKSIEQALTLVPVSRPQKIDPVIQRRSRLLKSIRKQKSLIDQHIAGEKTTRTWFWSGDDGKIYLQIKYGKAPIELSKGKFSIQCATLEAVIDALITVEGLVTRGEFDSVLATTSAEIRSKFTSKVAS